MYTVLENDCHHFLGVPLGVNLPTNSCKWTYQRY